MMTFTNEDTLRVSFADVERQKGSSDCGVIAIAFATALAHQSDPRLVKRHDGLFLIIFFSKFMQHRSFSSNNFKFYGESSKIRMFLLVFFKYI